MSGLEFDTTCIHCGRVNDIHSNVDGAEPSEDDISICWSCGGVATYNEDLQLVALTEERMAEIEAWPDFRQARASCMEALTPYQAVDLWRHIRGG